MYQTKVIVFDLYNTLIEIQKKQNIFGQIYRNCELQDILPFAEFIDLILTKKIETIINDLPTIFELEYKKNLLKFEKELNSVALFIETKSVLENLAKKYPLYLISNLASIYKQPYFDLEINQYFEKALFSCDLELRKPNPNIFRIVEDLSGKKGNQILMIGDSLSSDINGSKQLNWKTLRINRNKAIPKDGTIKSLLEIEKIIESLN